MRGLNLPFAVFFLFVAMMPDVAAVAQTTTAAASRSDDEELRETVRQLALRVSVLEEELHRQRAAMAPTQTASLQPATFCAAAGRCSEQRGECCEQQCGGGFDGFDSGCAGCYDGAEQSCGFGVAGAVAGRSDAELHVRWVLRV